jgi:adenosine deaminase
MRPSTLTELCERYGIERPPDTHGKQFDHFGEFVNLFWAACEGIRTHKDLARLVLEVAEDAAAHGAWWIEPATSYKLGNHAK